MSQKFQLKVGSHESSYGNPIPDTEKYVVLQSKMLGNFLKEDSDGTTDVKLKIKSSSGKTIYRLGVARSVDELTKDKIRIGYRSKNLLNISDDESVTVTTACWLSYLWNHCDSAIKWPFRLAFISVLMTMVSFFMQFVPLCNCCNF